MNDETDEAYLRGQRDQRLDHLEVRVSRLEKVALGIVGAVVASWAKIAGFWQ